MRILLVTHYYSTHRGGIEAVAHRLAETIGARAGWSIEWMASDCDPVPAFSVRSVRCTPARSWNGIERFSGLPYPLWSVAAVRELWRAVSRCDVVHLHDSLYMGNALAHAFAARQGKAVVVTQHIGAVPYEQRLFSGALSLLNHTVARRALSRASRVVFISPAVQQYFAAFCSFRLPPAYVPNGVDGELYGFADTEKLLALRREAGHDVARPLCLFVGRMVERKGLSIILAIARALPEVDWILAGDGPMRPEAARLPNVTVIRGRFGAQIARLYQMADLLVLPSRGEGFPLVVQEAMACGTPALVSTETAKGCPDAAPCLFTHDVLDEHAALGWTQLISRLVGERERLHAMRSGVAHTARRLWTWEAAAEAYESVFRALPAAR